jgi:2,3,4,5-tetrahydropyridine-2-carboxylate N-succinyltransferase
MTLSQLQKTIERHFAAGPSAIGDKSAMTAFFSLRSALETGEIRAASPDPASPTGWRVKQGILLGFRLGVLEELPGDGLSFVDKSTYPIRHFSSGDGIRVVPGGSSIRAGAYVARGVVCMPPMYVNAGAWVDEGTMVDSHALVGSCAQVGKRVHLSAAAQIGGVLEPVNASPVVIEDDVLVGGNSGRNHPHPRHSPLRSRQRPNPPRHRRPTPHRPRKRRSSPRLPRRNQRQRP